MPSVVDAGRVDGHLGPARSPGSRRGSAGENPGAPAHEVAHCGCHAHVRSLPGDAAPVS